MKEQNLRLIQVTKNEYQKYSEWKLYDNVHKEYPNPKIGKVYRNPNNPNPGEGSTITVTEIIGIDRTKNIYLEYTNPYTIQGLHIQNFTIIIVKDKQNE